MKKLVICTDGGARGNPGRAGIGIAIYENGRLIGSIGRYIGVKTNNEAEYEALIAGLEEALKIKAQEAELRLDSELAVRQLNSIYRVKNRRMQELVLRVRNLEQKFQKVTYRNIPREKNRLADQLVNKAIDKELSSATKSKKSSPQTFSGF